MVFYGYQIPKKNLDIRLKNLNLGLKNNAVLLANSQLRIQKINEIKLESDKMAVSTQTNSDPNAVVDLAIMNQQSLDELARNRGISNASDVSLSATSQSSTGLERAIASDILRAKADFAKEGRAFTADDEKIIRDKYKKSESTISSVLSGKPLKKTNKKISVGEELKRWAEEKLKNYNLTNTQKVKINEQVKKVVKDLVNQVENEELSREESIKFMEEVVDPELKKILENKPSSPTPSEGTTITLNSSTTLADAKEQIKNLRSVAEKDSAVSKLSRDLIKKFFIGLLNNGERVYGATGYAQKTIKLENELEVKGDNLVFKNTGNPQLDKYLNTAFKINTYENALTASGFRQNVSDRRPNFGNLYLSEKSLKKNTLTIYRPKSKLQLIARKNISPLLKKMILDIQNTLEFDKNDYNDLEADEKRIIERIIRLQQNMKDYNIKKLIDDDEVKIKKRLEILTSQINAGNNSKLVKDEMKYLIKQLLKNNAISYNK